MWALSEVREKVYNFQKLPLDKSRFITEVLIRNSMKIVLGNFKLRVKKFYFLHYASGEVF